MLLLNNENDGNWHDPCSIKSQEADQAFNIKPEIAHMKWETPAFNDIRFGFEVTMYINNK